MSLDSDKQSHLRQALEDTRRLWKFALGSPILYLLLGRLFVAMDWFDPSAESAHTYDTALTQRLFLLAAITIIIALAVLTWRGTHLPRSIASNSEAAIGRWTRNFYIRLSLCDSLAFLGLFYYLLSARTWGLLAGGAAAYVAYLFIYPRQANTRPFDQ
jgi:hypothetical protein